RNAFLTDQTQICLVHQRRWRECVTHALVSQIEGCTMTQLCVDERHQIVSRTKIAPPPRSKQTSNQAGLITLHRRFRPMLASPLRSPYLRSHDAVKSDLSL